MRRTSLCKLLRGPAAGAALQRRSLALAIGSAMAIGLSGTVWGQATNGTIYGTVPAASGESVRVTGGAGYDRTVPVTASGQYSVTLPVGTYTVSLLRDGEVVDSRGGVSPVAAGAVRVNFTAGAEAEDENAVKLSEVSVSANSLPPIDVTTTNQVTTTTAEQLQRLPLGHAAADIAMMAPGVNMGSAQLNAGPLGTGVNVFGGASTAENAYYIDGMNVSDALYAQGGLELPYGVISQQQTYVSGYGAKYGRSIGGVINQIGKSGSNEWHFGGRMQLSPSSWTASTRNYYYVNPLSTQPGQRPGDLQHYQRGDSGQTRIYDAYVSGPLIKDKLFFYLSAEQYKSAGSSVGSVYDPYQYNYDTRRPKVYAKLDWNINDRNILTLTGLQTSRDSRQSVYDFDYDDFRTGDFSHLAQTSKRTFKMWVANYTSYITDALTLNAMFGKTHGRYFETQPAYPGYDPELPHIGGVSMQNPAFVPPGGVQNSQTSTTESNPNQRVNVMSYRLDLDYKLGDHDLRVGIDNINSWDIDDGYVTTGPGYYWSYGVGDPGKPLFGVSPDSPPYVAPAPQDACHTGDDGKVHCYYVSKSVSSATASVKVAQRAQYIMDSWQVTPRFLLTLGLRNDQFTNYNSNGEPYIRLTKPQWAPRIGFSWDVHGDSSLKVFGNAGRYYLALPLTTARWIASPVVSMGQYGTYTGIDPETGEPTGFEPLPQNPSTGVSINSEYGQPKDPRVSAARNIEAEYSDSFVLGMQQEFQMLGSKWVFGVTGTYDKMDRIIDDFGDTQIMCAAGRAQGYDWMTSQDCSNYASSLLLINPGETNEIWMKDPDGGLVPVTLTNDDIGFPKGPTRRHYSIDLSLEHVWDGKWFAKVDYVFAKTWGNTEGPVSTYSQQSGSYESLTTAWDFPERMEFSSGVLPNDRRHQLKLHGAYAITPEWMVGANWYLASGTPRLCRGYYGPDEIKLHGSSTFYWCGGKPVPPGSLGRLPWTRQLDMNVSYKPAWADHKLRFEVEVFNVFNNQKPTFINNLYLSTQNPNPDYGRPNNTQAPRFARFSVSYDF